MDGWTVEVKSKSFFEKVAEFATGIFAAFSCVIFVLVLMYSAN